MFFYSIEQLQDRNESRSETFRNTLQDFLGLTMPIPMFGHANINRDSKRRRFRELIDICEDRYAPIRWRLVQHGAETAQWMMNEFLTSPDVTVANHEHLKELLSGWGTDPCEEYR